MFPRVFVQFYDALLSVSTSTKAISAKVLGNLGAQGVMYAYESFDCENLIGVGASSLVPWSARCFVRKVSIRSKRGVGGLCFSVKQLRSCCRDAEKDAFRPPYCSDLPEAVSCAA